MKRWPLKARAILLIAGTVLCLMTILLGFLSYQIRVEASRAVASEVNRTWMIFDREEKQREKGLLSAGRIIANLPILGATIDTGDSATVNGSLQNYLAMDLGWNLFLATDQNGRILGRVASSKERGVLAKGSLSISRSVISDALHGRGNAGFFFDGANLYQIATVPVHIGGETEGTLTVGEQVSDSVAQALKSVSDSDISFIVNDAIVASTLTIPRKRLLEERLRQETRLPSRSPVFVSDDTGASDLIEIAPLPDSNARGRIVMQRSLRQALSTYHRLLNGLYVAGFFALALAIAVSMMLADSVTGPILSIAQVARDLSSGVWDRRATVGSNDELRDLADSFNHMADRLQKWDEELRREVETRTEELNAAVMQLDRAYQQIRDFNADAAHELLTPLTIIRGELEVTLRNPREPNEYRRVLATVLDETTRLSRIVEQLLALAHADAGEASPLRDRIPLSRPARDAFAQLAMTAETKGIDLRLIDSPELFVNGDEGWLRQLFFNLIDNAVKYSSSGGTVVVSWTEREHVAQIEVRDDGPGIAPEHLPRIFDRFYRVDKSRSRSMGGSGLGLAICRWIAKAHHGDIAVVSRLGEGSVFTASLPIEPDSLDSALTP